MPVGNVKERARSPLKWKIEKFEGEYRWLSNFASASVTLDGERYPSVEHAYQAAKTLDPDKRTVFQIGGVIDIQPDATVRRSLTAAGAKKAGKAIQLRKDWELVKVDIMRDLLKQKFSMFVFKKLLLETGDAELIEGNWWGDRYWGVCHGTGQNMLGRLIMDIRTELQKEQNNVD